MRRLTIIVATGEAARLRAALEIAAAQAALGHPARVFLRSDAAPLLRSDNATLAHMLAEALALGVSVGVCQSGLADAGIVAGDLAEGIETGGLIELMSDTDEDQLLMA